ncbi:MAG: hypothetical protein IJI22_02550 [Bacilli bacterium]|nr:hypothetical protein [Bacilli bacterium]
MKKIFKLIMLILIIFFLSLYFSRINYYQENKTILTDKAIKQFEKDLQEGRQIDSKNYIEEEKNYNNKPSKIARKTSHFIENSFSKSLKYLMHYLETLE